MQLYHFFTVHEPFGATPALTCTLEPRLPPPQRHACPRPTTTSSPAPAAPPAARPAEFRATPVPDFRRLHGEFERQLAEVKAANPFRSTVPEEFHLADCR